MRCSTFHLLTTSSPSQGVPVRLEVGPRDIAANEVKAIRRVDGHKSQVPLEGIAQTMLSTLEEIHQLMFNKAKKEFDDHVIKVDKWEDFVPTLDGKNVCIIPWCEKEACEDDIKDRSASV